LGLICTLLFKAFKASKKKDICGHKSSEKGQMDIRTDSLRTEELDDIWWRSLEGYKSKAIRPCAPVAKPTIEAVSPEPKGSDVPSYRVNVYIPGWIVDRPVVDYVISQYKPDDVTPGDGVVVFGFVEPWRAKYLVRRGPDDLFLRERLGSDIKMALAAPPVDKESDVKAPGDGRAEGLVDGVQPLVVKMKDPDVNYFNSYGRLSIHRTMLRDTVRVGAYADAIAGTDMRGKVVLDVGSGTGLLAMMAASKGGARKVYAVEKSSMAVMGSELVERNGLSDRVQTIHSSVEEVDEGVIAPVDFIISEWMGYALIYEKMLLSVLQARDKWLKPGTGRMLPNRARIQLCGFYDPNYIWRRLGDSDRLWETDRTPTIDHICGKIFVEKLPVTTIATNECQVADLNLETCSAASASRIDSSFVLRFKPGFYTLNGIAIYFSVRFEQANVTLRTSPSEPTTHWKQALLIFRTPLNRKSNPNAPIQGRICLSNRESDRGLDCRVVVYSDTAAGGHPDIQQDFALD